MPKWNRQELLRKRSPEESSEPRGDEAEREVEDEKWKGGKKGMDTMKRLRRMQKGVDVVPNRNPGITYSKEMASSDPSGFIMPRLLDSGGVYSMGPHFVYGT